MGGLLDPVSGAVDGTIGVVQGGAGAGLDVVTGTIDFTGGGLTEIADGVGEATANPILAGLGVDHLLGFDATASGAGGGGGGGGEQPQDSNQNDGLPMLALVVAGVAGVYLLTQEGI